MTAATGRADGLPRRTRLPLAALVVLPTTTAAVLSRPSLDWVWQDQRAHFWLVGAAALGGAVAAAMAAEAAGRRGDARLFLLAYSFAIAAATLGLHSLATPTVVVDGPNAGFEYAVPVGLGISALVAAAATFELGGELGRRVVERRQVLWSALALVAIAAATSIVSERGLLADPPDETTRDGLVVGLGVSGSLLFAFAALRFAALHRTRPGARLLTVVVVALVLLGDTIAVVPIGRTWQASWWEWHLLLVAAFVAIASTLRGELRRESGRAGVFDSLALEETLARVRLDDSTALENLVDALERVEDAGDDSAVAPFIEDVVRRFDLTDRQGHLLARAAHALHDNRRLYRELDALFRSYLSPDVAAALVSEPTLASLGGTEREISVLYADLSGFTSYAESNPPGAVIEMVNAYFGAIVPPIFDEGGTITMFAGDAIMAVFGAPARQPDHAARACRAALALASAAADAAEQTSWPRFRIGVSTGPAIVGNVGSDALRSYTAIGDTVNVAARLEAAAPVGGIWISDATRQAVGSRYRTEPRNEVYVKGRTDPVTAHLLIGA